MFISTKGRYALKIVIDLAQHLDEGYVPLKEVSERQDLPVKYLEAIVPPLCRGGILRSQRGTGGGYCLARDPADISVGEIVVLTEGKLSPVSCLECGENTCEKAPDCMTLPMWETLDSMIADYLGSVSIDDIISGKINKKKVNT